MKNAITWHFMVRVKGIVCLAVGCACGLPALAVPGLFFVLAGIAGELLDGVLCVACTGCGRLDAFNGRDTAASFGWCRLKRLRDGDDPHATHSGLCFECRAVEVAAGQGRAGRA